MLASASWGIEQGGEQMGRAFGACAEYRGLGRKDVLQSRAHRWEEAEERGPGPACVSVPHLAPGRSA